jgi:putative transposase
MPRAHRHFLPGHIWHITDRCHARDFLLKQRDDRQNWLSWLREARRRYGLCVLNYIVTCNHVHLLVLDRGAGEIAASMQLVAGRVAQTYNKRHERQGAFWQDRYHATAVQSDGHLMRCMAYIDLNMVRAGVAAHPSQWRESGYREIQRLPQRYRIIDMPAVAALVGCDTPAAARALLGANTERVLVERTMRREAAWTESLAVGSNDYLQEVKRGLGLRARARAVVESEGLACLREESGAYLAAAAPVVTTASVEVAGREVAIAAGASEAAADGQRRVADGQRRI